MRAIQRFLARRSPPPPPKPTVCAPPAFPGSVCGTSTGASPSPILPPSPAAPVRTRRAQPGPTCGAPEAAPSHPPRRSSPRYRSTPWMTATSRTSQTIFPPSPPPPPPWTSIHLELSAQGARGPSGPSMDGFFPMARTLFRPNDPATATLRPPLHHEITSPVASLLGSARLGPLAGILFTPTVLPLRERPR